MSEAGIKLDPSKITQTIDLNKIIGSDISDDEVLVTKIGQGILDYISDRVESGLGLDRVKLKSPYSPEYANSLDFKAAGKSKTHVNMQLSGDMMGSIDLLKTDGSKITIGIEDKEQAAKAYGHITDFKGHPTLAGKGNARPFFGVTPEEIKKYVISEFKSDINKSIASNKVTSSSAINKIINEIRGKKTLADLLEITDED